MTENIIQFAPLFDAVGAELNYRTKDRTVEVVEYPKGKKQLIDDAVEEISHYLDTRIFEDGIAFLAIASYIDGVHTSITMDSKTSILSGLGLQRDGKYIQQVISLNKINKSWHTSDIANACSYFGDICVRRGVEEVPGKRGRKSTRNPADYHEVKSNGTINREQLVTPGLEALHRAIPTEKVTSAVKPRTMINLAEIQDIDPEVARKILAMIEEAKAG